MKLEKFKVAVKNIFLGKKDTSTRKEKDIERRRKFEELNPHIDYIINLIDGLSINEMNDEKYLEEVFIPLIGLNDEILKEQPPELGNHFGNGLHLWQYPNQLAKLLSFLSVNRIHVNSYLEIGCRWGGMSILLSQWLKKLNPEFNRIIVIDPIDTSPFLIKYQNIISNRFPNIDFEYVKSYSTDPDFVKKVASSRPEFVFIDGDHRMNGALHDHMMVREFAKYILHHDISSDSCRDTTQLWIYLKTLEANTFDNYTFDSQYESVQGSYLGLGLLARK